ncbi:MAG: InlB B-repeat-containing protein [Clostridia bacterium]|nr:InlB B-repeat-containing protein [Clostridia bacterium]
MQKTILKNRDILHKSESQISIKIIIIAIFMLMGIMVIGATMFVPGQYEETAFAEGDEPLDARAKIGFSTENYNYNEFYIEENGGAVTVRVYVSEVQTVDIPFTLTETRYEAEDALFVFQDRYTLPASSSYTDITFYQIAQAESGSDVRMSDIFIHCDTDTVTIADVEYYGENEPYDDDYLAIVYDKDGESELIVEQLPFRSYETDCTISSRLVRAGAITSDVDIYYNIKDYDPENTKELVFENYNSVINFGANERNKTFELNFIDNDRLNLREAYELELTAIHGVSKIFDLNYRRYLEEEEILCMDFAIHDDEPLSDKYVARAQYYQPGETDPAFQVGEGGQLDVHVVLSGLRDMPLTAFRLYYSIEAYSTAVYSEDYIIVGNYSHSNNLGYIDAPAGEEYYIADLKINVLDDAIFNGTRTVYVKFFINGRSDILLQPLDTVRIEITDNEILPDNNTLSWDLTGLYNCCGVYEDNTLTINENYYDRENYIIGIDTDYHGTAPLNIPVRFEDVTATNGIDYSQESTYTLLTFMPFYGDNRYGIDINLINNFYFSGTRRLKVTIIGDGLTPGITLSGSAVLYIDIVGRVKDDYSFIEYTQEEIDDIFSIGKKESLTFQLKRLETVAESTYLDLTRGQQGAFIEGTHIAADLFPYEVVWAENETQKTITFEFLQDWNDTNSAAGFITCLDGNMMPFDIVYGDNQRYSVPITLYMSNSAACYYFPGSDMLSLIQYEYLYSSDSILRIPVTRELLSKTSANTSVSYHLTFDYYKTEQLILSSNVAEIGTHINNLSGTLYFYGAETTKYITVTVPDTVKMAYGSKYVNLVLSEPSDETYLLYNWDYAGKFSLVQIKITNDITPILTYGDLTTTTSEDGGFETTVIDALEYEGKECDSFRVELIPYETDETPYQTGLYYAMDINLYSVYDLSTVGVEVFGNGTKLESISITPFIYEYTDGSGSHQVTYNYANVLHVNLYDDNPYASFTLRYSEIYLEGLQFISTNLLIKTYNQYLMNGWQTYEKQLFLNACGADAEVNVSITPASLVSEGETNVQAGDNVYLTVTRSSDDSGASTMFFRSIAYGVKSFAASADATYYFEPLDTFVVFEPYERSKTVAFVTRDNRPQGTEWDSAASAALIRLFNYYDTNEIYGELTVNVCEEWSVTLINAEVQLLTDYVNIHKRSGDPYDPITVKFIFDKTYEANIEFNISGLDARLGNMTAILPAGQTEIIHSFTINENDFTASSEVLYLNMTGALITLFGDAELKLSVPEGMKVNVYSEMISSQKFHAGVPDVLSINEDNQGYISLEIIANRSEYPSTWKDVNAFVTLGGTAVYGEDYIIKYDGKGNNNTFDLSTGIVVIYRLYEKSTIKVYPIDNNLNEGDKTIELTVLDYCYGHAAYPETLIFALTDNEYFGDVGIETSESNIQKTITLSRKNHTVCDLPLNYVVEELSGVYGIDYRINTKNSSVLEKNGVLTFNGDLSYIYLYVETLTEIGNRATFNFRISVDKDTLFSIITNNVFVSLRNIFEGGEFTARTAKTDSQLNKWPGNYTDFLLDYTEYYSSYSSGAKIKVNSQNFEGVTEDVYLDFNPDGLTYISASGRSGKYAVPSGISPNHWYDINDDGIKELIFVANLDSCFGGASELASTGLCGVYALDLVSGNYTLIFALDSTMASRHLDIYINDLKGDGFPDVVVFSTPWADRVFRRNGSNILYIVDNTNGMFTIENVYDGNAVINGTNMTLYSVIVTNKYKNYDRNYIEVSYYSHTDRFLGLDYGTVIELSAEENAHFIYCEGANYGIEGTNFVLTVNNVTGAAGTATLVFRSDNAVYGRDYLPENLTLTFAQGEYVKNVTLVTLNNNIPTDELYIYFYLESDDFNVGVNNNLCISVIDASVVNKGVAYTVLEGFDSSYTNSEYITGDSAAFSLDTLTINGIRCIATSNDRYDVRFSVRFGNSTWTDEDNDGLIAVTGLQNIYLSSDNPHYIYIDVEFLYEGTNTAISRKSFSAWYYYYDANSSDYKIVNEVEISETIYMGKLHINAESMISCRDSQIPGRFLFSFTSNINNKTYNFYSDNSGLLNAQIEYGIIQGMFDYSYTITPLSVQAQAYTSGQMTLRAYKDTMDFPVTVIDSVRQTLLRNVLIEIVGINTNFSYSGHSDAETGLFTIPELIPQRTYRITVNGDYGINYFKSYTAVICPTVEEPNLSVSLEIRREGASLDNVSVIVIKQMSISASLKILANKHSYTGDYGRIVRYLAGESVQLDSGAEQILTEYLKSAYIYSNYYVQSKIIRGDLLFSNDYPNVYKSLAKNADDITLVSYRYNPDYDFGDVNVLLGREELTSENCRCLSYSYSIDYYGSGDYQTDVVHFYSFNGAENCIIDIEIESEAYLNGKKTVPLASFGTGLGSFLIQPVQDVFASIETASVPTNFAFLNGMSFMLGFADIDFAFDYDEENMTFSLYMGASKDLYEKSRGMSYGDIGRPTLAQLRAAKAAGLGMGRGQAGLGVGLGGKMTFKYEDGDWKLRAGEIYFSVNASYNYTKYILLPIVSIPAFFSATVSLELETTIYFNWIDAEEYTEVTGDLAIELALEIECGIGIKGFLSASIYGRAGIEVIIQIESGATKLTLYVEGGVRIQIVFWKYQYSFGRAEWSTQSDGYVEREAIMQSLCLSQLSNTTSYTGVAALYSTSGQLMMGIGLGEDGEAEDIVLISNVYEKSSPQIAELTDGTKMIAWINYDIVRGEDNAEVINYIYFDGESWSEVAVADETITADLDLDIKVIDGSFAIICTEVKEELSQGSTISERLLKSDVAVLVFNAATKTFNKTVMTNNLFNDRQVLFDYESGYGIAVDYRSENTNITDDMTINDFLCGENADNKLYYSIFNTSTDSWGEFSLFQYALPAVSTMSVKIVGGIAYIALECDNDDNFDTTLDREIMLLQYVFATGQSRLQQLTDNVAQDVCPSLMEFKGKVFMAYRSGDDVRYWYENDSYFVCTLPQNYTNFEMFASGEYAVMLFTMPVEGVAQVFASVMDGDSMAFSIPMQITSSAKSVRDPILAFSGNETSVYYCADTYTLLSSSGEECTFSVTSDIVSTGFNLSSELSIEVLEPDFAEMLPGEEYEFTVRIYNNGTLNVVSPWINVYLGETLIADTVAGTVLGNGYLDVLVSITLPSTRSTLRFVIGKENLEENLDNNFAETDVLLSNISIDKDNTLTWNENGTLKVILSVTNQGAVPMNSVTIIVTSYSNASIPLASSIISSIAAGETKIINLIIEKENVIFNSNNELWLKAFALTADKDIYTVGIDDYDVSDNLRSLHIARAVFADGSTLALLTESIDLAVGNNGYLGIVYTGDGEVGVTSSDPSVVEVNGNNLSALKNGTVTIMVSDGSVSKSLLVTVTGQTIFTVTFKNSDGTVIRTETLAVGSAITAPVAPEKSGYTFGGWNTAVAETMTGGDATYIAQWVLSNPVVMSQSGYSGKYDGEEHFVNVEASHTLGSVTYQWYKGSISSENIIEGQNGATLSVENSSDSGTYYCRISYTDGEQTTFTDSEAIEVNITDIIMTGGAIAGMTIGTILLLAIAAYIVLYVGWKKKNKKSPAFLVTTFRKVNKLMFKTELNDIEKSAETSKF